MSHSVSVVINAVKELSDNKSCGLAGIHAEHMQNTCIVKTFEFPWVAYRGSSLVCHSVIELHVGSFKRVS